MSRIASPLTPTANQFRAPVAAKPKRKGLRQLGKKGKQWAAIRAELKPRFEAAGITECELRYEDCWFDNALSFAHSKRRRFCSEQDLWIVCLCCTPCHQILDSFDHKTTEHIVNHVINMRARRP